LRRGQPTGAAMPLCWSHAEYVSLVRSRHDGICFDRIEPAFQRYVAKSAPCAHEIWCPRYPLRQMRRGVSLRFILPADATLVWSVDSWANKKQTDLTAESILNLWFTDLPSAEWASGATLEFTFFWKKDQRWEGQNWQIRVI
jgi:glucoamylase